MPLQMIRPKNSILLQVLVFQFLKFLVCLTSESPPKKSSVINSFLRMTLIFSHRGEGNTTSKQILLPNSHMSVDLKQTDCQIFL